MSIISKLIYGISITAGGIVESKFNKITKNSREENKKTLLKILHHNKDTEIGKRYNFEKINSINDFKNNFPITDYSYYEKYIECMANGEKNILVADKIEYFGHTSGTTGKQKLIPATKKARMIASKYMAFLTNKFSYDNFKENWNYAKGLMIADIVTTTYTKGNIKICSATSGGMKSMEKILPHMYTSPIEVIKVKDKQSALYLHLLFSLNYKKLFYISSVFISNILDLLRILEDKNEDLIKDIRRGTINSKINIDKDIRKKLTSMLKPDAARADFLEGEFNKGFKGICKRIWPKFSYLLCVTGANFSIYDEKVNYYTDNVPIYSPSYAASEGMIGINPSAYDEIKYIVIPDTVFYEFLLVDEEDTNKTYCIDELKIGGRYEIIITTYSGLYRYKLGDVIEVVGFYNKSPEIIFLYRKNQILNMVSEKTNEEHLTKSIIKLSRKENINIIDYTTMPDNSITPGRYIIYIEFKENVSSIDIMRFERILDNELQKANLAYGRFRNNKRLNRLKIVALESGTFEFIKEKLFSEGISKNQIKIPRVLINKENILKMIKIKQYKAI